MERAVAGREIDIVSIPDSHRFRVDGFLSRQPLDAEQRPGQSFIRRQDRAHSICRTTTAVV